MGFGVGGLGVGVWGLGVGGWGLGVGGWGLDCGNATGFSRRRPPPPQTQAWFEGLGFRVGVRGSGSGFRGEG